MPDSLATMLASIDDGGENTAAEMRAVIQALYDWIPPIEKYKMGRLPSETAHADDDFFSTYSGYTELAVTGSATWSLGHSGLGVSFTGQSANDGAVALKAFTASGPPLTIETAMSLLTKRGANPGAGIILSDGVISTSNCMWTGVLSTNNFYGGSGTLTNLGAVSAGQYDGNGEGLLYLRLIWKSANNFARAYSLDGHTWTDFAAADTGFTLTPTHIGFVGTAWSVAGPHLATYKYLRVYETDLSV